MQITRMHLAFGLAAALFTAGTAYAQGPGDGGPGFGPHRPPMERAMGPHGDHGRWWNEPRIVEKYKLTDAQRKSAGAGDDVVRLSIGLEDKADIIADLAQALAA